MPILTATAEFSVCPDCYVYIGTGDATSYSLWLDDDEASDAIAVADAGIARMAADGNIVCVASPDDELGFCITPCDCCGSILHGDRHVVVRLSF